MKKLFTLISFLAFFSLIFIGCQSTEDITAPNNELDKTASSFSFPSCPLSPIDGEVDMVAGQHNPVGTVSFSWDGSFLTVTYANTLASGLTMSEIHLDFAKERTNDPNTGFHLNKQNNPQVGHFDINESFDPRVSSKTYQISKSELLGFLGVSTLPDNIFIAAHAVVGSGDCDEPPCPTVPESAEMRPAFYSGTDVTAGNYTFRARPEFNLNDEIGINWYIPSGTSQKIYFNGWCVDQENSIISGEHRQVKFVCSYDYDPTTCDFIDQHQNLPLVNWIINNRDGYDLWDVQVAIWELINPVTGNPGIPLGVGDWGIKVNTDNVAQLKADAEYYGGLSYVPECGEKVGVIAYSVNENCDVEYQLILIEKPVCCGDETAWGFDWDFDHSEPLDGLSCRFVEQGNWARYFQFSF